MQVMQHHFTPSTVPEHLKIATKEQEFQKIWARREIEFTKYYPALTHIHFQDDVYDANAYVLYSESEEGEIISTGRLVFDGVFGLPADEVIHGEVDKLRHQGLRVAESSKLAIASAKHGIHILPFYFYTYYEIAVQYQIDSVIFVMATQHIQAYKRFVDVNILVDDIGYSYGTQKTFALLECRILETAATISKRMGGK